MNTSIDLYSMKNNEIENFLSKYYESNITITDPLHWHKDFKNPIEIADFIGIFIDNYDSYKITMWISLDENLLININSTNANNIIKYLFERYPY